MYHLKIFLFLLFLSVVHLSIGQQQITPDQKVVYENQVKEFAIDKIKVAFIKKGKVSEKDWQIFLENNADYYYKTLFELFNTIRDGNLTEKQLAQRKNEFVNSLVKKYQKEWANLKNQNPSLNKSAHDGCVNSDFEEGSLNGWDVFSGIASTNISPDVSRTTYNVELISGNGFDIHVGNNILKEVAPGGAYSLRIGDQFYNASANKLSQTFTVTANNAKYTYKYACVLEDGKHMANEQAYFKVKIFDQYRNLIKCVYDSLTPTSPFINLLYNGAFYYKNWTENTVLLGAYIGQKVTIEFTVQDCVFGAHLGYAYIDGACLPLQITASKLEMCAGEEIVLTSSEDFDTYQWYGPGIVGDSTSKSIKINKPGDYKLIVKSGECYSPIFIHIDGNIISSNTKFLCPGDTAHLEVNEGFLIHNWTGPGIVGASNGRKIKINQPGIYEVKVGEQSSCANKFQVFTVDKTIAGADMSICRGDSVQLHALNSSTDLEWSPNTTIDNYKIHSPTVFPLQTTAYVLKNVCGLSDTVVVKVTDQISGIISSEVKSCSILGATIGVNMVDQGNYSYEWSPNSHLNATNLSHVIATPPKTQMYHLKVKLGKNCFFEDSVKVEIGQQRYFKARLDNDTICEGSKAQVQITYNKISGKNNTSCDGNITAVKVGKSDLILQGNNETILDASLPKGTFQLLFRKDEFINLGINLPSTLNEIGFDVTEILGTNIFQNFSIRIGTTKKSALGNTLESDLVTVFNPKSVLIHSGINYFALDETYDCDQISNLIVEFSYSNNGTSNNSSIKGGLTTFKSFMASALNNQYSTFKRPTIYFKYCNQKNDLSNLKFKWQSTPNLSDLTSANPWISSGADETFYLTAIDQELGCEYLDSIKIKVINKFEVKLIDSLKTCDLMGTRLNIEVTGNGNYQYLWKPAANFENNKDKNPIFIPDISRWIHVSVKASYGCELFDSVKIIVPDLKKIRIDTPAEANCENSSAPLNLMMGQACGLNNSQCVGTLKTFKVSDGTTSSSSLNTTPFSGGTNGARIQFLYTKNELVLAGMTSGKTISQLGFQVANGSGNNRYQDFTIKMSCSSDEELTATFIPDLQTVFNAKTIQISTGINYFQFDNLYDWDGNSNLVVEICFSNPAPFYNSAVFYSATALTSVCTVNGSNVCGEKIGSLSKNRPIIYLKGCEQNLPANMSVLWTPANYLSNNTIANPLATIAENFTYSVTVIDSRTGCKYKDTINLKVLPTQLSLGKDTTICKGATLELKPTAGFDSYLWSDGSTDSYLNVRVAGTYWVVGKNKCGEFRDSCVVKFDSSLDDFTLGNDTTLCTGSVVHLNKLNSNFNAYLWQDGSRLSTFNVTQPGKYWLQVFNSCGSRLDSLRVTKYESKGFDLGKDTILCAGNTITIGTSQSYLTYEWNDLSVVYSKHITQSGNYILKARDLCKLYIDSIEIKFIDKPFVSLGADQKLCEGTICNLQVPEDGGILGMWSDNSTSYSFQVNQSGNYWVTLKNNCGSMSDTVKIEFIKPSYVNLGPDTILCSGRLLQLSCNNPNTNSLWSNGSTASSYTVSQTGVYWLQATNVCGTVRDSIKVSFEEIPQVDLGADQLVCKGENVNLQLIGQGVNNLIWSTNSSANSIQVIHTGKYWVTVKNSCGAFSDTIKIEFLSPINLNLGRDTLLCKGQQIALKYNGPSADLLWSNGTSGALILVADPGIFWLKAKNVCGQVSDSIRVRYDELPTVDLGADTVICASKSIVITPKNPFNSYHWSSGETAPSIQISKPGTYWVTTVNANKCKSSDSIKVASISLPTLDLGSDLEICEGESITIGIPNSNCDFKWQDNSTSNYFDTKKAGIYHVTASNRCGSVIDSIRITTLICDCHLDLPSAFSPNGDGNNDVLYLRGNCTKNIDLVIYDRWGEKVFESNSIQSGWDGTVNGVALNSAVFYYHLSADSGTAGKKIVKKGNISLIR